MTYDEIRAAQLRAGNLLLPNGDHRRERQYVMPSPDALGDAYERAYDAAWYRPQTEGGEVTLDKQTLRDLISLAGGYLTLTTYALGQEHCVGKLRDIWRARRAAR